MTEKIADSFGHSPISRTRTPATDTAKRVNTRVTSMRPMFALPEMVGTALKMPANTLVTAWVSTVFFVSPGVAMRLSATVVVAAVVPSISTTPQTAMSVMTRHASRGNDMPQCSG